MPAPKDPIKYKQWKEKISINLKGQRHSPKTEFKKEIHYSLKTEFTKGQKPWNFGTKGLTKGMLGKHHSEKSNKKNRISTLNRNYKHSSEVKEIIRNTSRERWQNKDYKDRTLKSMLEACQLKPNKAETKLGIILNNILPNEYKYVGNGQFIIGGKCPDFLNINGKKKLIELYGDYWHKDDNPQNRIDCFKQYGFETLIIWEKDLQYTEKLKVLLLDFNNKGAKP